MLDLIILFSSIALCALIWWWITNRLKNNGRGWLLRNFVGFSFGSFAGITLLVTALSKDNIEPSSEEIINKKTIAAVSAISEKSLEMDADTYFYRLDKILQPFSQHHRIMDKKLTTGASKNSFSANIDQNVFITGTISKTTGNLFDLNILSKHNLPPLEFAVMVSAALTAANISVEQKVVFEKIPDLLKGQELTYGKIKFSSIIDKNIGIWVFAKPI